MNGKRAKALRRFALKVYNPAKHVNDKATNPWRNWRRFIKRHYLLGTFVKDKKVLEV